MGVMLIAAGIVVFLIPTGWQTINKYKQDKMMEDIKKQILENAAQTREPESSDDPVQAYTELQLEQYDGDMGEVQEYEPPDKDDPVKQILESQSLVGIIEIEKIDIMFPIVEGTDRENIRAAIGHMKGTAPPGGDGNCVLAGHRGGVYGIFFKNINKLEEGDTVKLTDLEGNEYIYAVYEQFVVEPWELWVIDAVEDKNTLTLVSCENEGTMRLIVRCELQ